jgi:hypothetical protein
MVAYIERAWVEALASGRLYRYDLPPERFESLHDAGMFVCRSPIEPLGVEPIDGLPAALRRLGVELRVVGSLVPLKDLWSSSLHVSGIRLRNAVGWAADR